jgi:hypothetical protein
VQLLSPMVVSMPARKANQGVIERDLSRQPATPEGMGADCGVTPAGVHAARRRERRSSLGTALTFAVCLLRSKWRMAPLIRERCSLVRSAIQACRRCLSDLVCRRSRDPIAASWLTVT